MHEQANEILYICKFTECGAELTGNGNIVSSNFPNNYNIDEECVWKITANEGDVITLTFNSFDVEYNSQCSWDYLVVWDGTKEIVT